MMRLWQETHFILFSLLRRPTTFKRLPRAGEFSTDPAYSVISGEIAFLVPEGEQEGCVRVVVEVVPLVDEANGISGVIFVAVAAGIGQVVAVMGAREAQGAGDTALQELVHGKAEREGTDRKGKD